MDFHSLFHNLGDFLKNTHGIMLSVAPLRQIKNTYSYGIAYDGLHSVTDVTFFNDRPDYAIYGNAHTAGHLIQHRRGHLDIAELTHWRFNTINALPTAAEREEKILMHCDIDREATNIALTLWRDAHRQGCLGITDEEFYEVLIPSMMAHYRHDVSLHIGTLQSGKPPIFGTDIKQTICHPWVIDPIILDSPIEILPATSIGMPLVFHVHPAGGKGLLITKDTDKALRHAAKNSYGNTFSS
jgi:hypothetical protein